MRVQVLSFLILFLLEIGKNVEVFRVQLSFVKNKQYN